MPDRYEIKRFLTDSGKPSKAFPWALYRISDDPDFPFVKTIGLFDTKRDAGIALNKIAAHKDMNFAEWFFVHNQFVKNDMVDADAMERHFYKLWRAISGHLTVQRVREYLDDVALAMTCYASGYSQRADDLEEEIVVMQNGEDM